MGKNHKILWYGLRVNNRKIGYAYKSFQRCKLLLVSCYIIIKAHKLKDTIAYFNKNYVHGKFPNEIGRAIAILYGCNEVA